MAIFNSLGSNYSRKFIWHSLLAGSSASAEDKLKEQLGQRYGGQVTLTYKGREALELALRWSELPTGSAVGINGFTCFVVYQAVVNAGYKPVFIDVAERQMHFGVRELRTVHEKMPDLKAIIIQNTLGYPADMSALEKYAREHDIMIVEDLAHSTGATYEDGDEVGTIGQFTMLSFSQDKPLDIVAGGAVVDRRSQPAQTKFEAPLVSAWQRTKNRFYPFWTGLIRSFYSLGLGRPLHFGLKRLRWLATPMSDSLQGLHQMSRTTPKLLLNRLAGLDDELARRRQIATIYKENLAAEIQFAQTKGQAAYLRFPLWVNDRATLIRYLRQQKIYIGDTWYDAPVAPKRYLAQTSYQAGLCPNAEELAEHIVNLPTHRHVTPEKAQFICAKIKQWQASK